MAESERAGPLPRVMAAVGGSDVVERLAGLSGSDFTSLMLEVARRRADAQTPADVLRRYRADRFVRPAEASWQAIRRAEELLAATLRPEFELLTLAPLVPLGTHSALGPVSQDKVVTAMRSCEVAADPTNALALEAVSRRVAMRAAGGTRRQPTGRNSMHPVGRYSEARAGADTWVRLAAFQRVVRAQQLMRPGYLAHFSLLGLVTAGRDGGGRRFERESVAGHIRALAAGLAAAGLAPAQLALTPLSDAGEAIALALPGELAGTPVEIVLDRERVAGRGYYRDLCYKINVRAGRQAGGGELVEIGDGGFTDWAARLAASNKERLLISGVGIDRLAASMSPQPGRERAAAG
jgi:hypothetical protein